MESNTLLTTGLALTVLAVVLVIGGMLLIQTYQVSLDVTGSGLVYTNYSSDTCAQDLPTEASACGGLATGTITSAGWAGITGGANAYDKDWVTNSTDFVNATPKTLIFNYKIPANHTSAIMELKWDNATGTPSFSNVTLVGGNCRNSTGTYSFMINVTANESFAIECINDSAVYDLLGYVAMPNESFQFFEQKMWWGINRSHSNYTASADPLIDSVYHGTGMALTTFTSLLPLMALAIVGGIAIVYMLTQFGRKTA